MWLPISSSMVGVVSLTGRSGGNNLKGYTIWIKHIPLKFFSGSPNYPVPHRMAVFGDRALKDMIN